MFIEGVLSLRMLTALLAWTQRLSLVAFMISALFIVIGDVFRNTLWAVFALYLFIGVTWVRHSRENGVAIDKITQEIAGIVLGTVMIVILLVGMFNLMNAFG